MSATQLALRSHMQRSFDEMREALCLLEDEILKVKLASDRFVCIDVSSKGMKSAYGTRFGHAFGISQFLSVIFQVEDVKVKITMEKITDLHELRWFNSFFEITPRGERSQEIYFEDGPKWFMSRASEDVVDLMIEELSNHKSITDERVLGIVADCIIRIAEKSADIGF